MQDPKATGFPFVKFLGSDLFGIETQRFPSDLRKNGAKFFPIVGVNVYIKTSTISDTHTQQPVRAQSASLPGRLELRHPAGTMQTPPNPKQ